MKKRPGAGRFTHARELISACRMEVEVLASEDGISQGADEALCYVENLLAVAAVLLAGAAEAQERARKARR